MDQTGSGTTRQITPTDKQSAFITTDKRYACMSGGYGCVAGETKIFNPHTNENVRIDELVGLDVLSYHSKDNRFHTARALTVPRKYSKDRLFRVITKTGRSIVVTQKHKFYSFGWETLSSLFVGSVILCADSTDKNPHYESIVSIEYERTDFYYDLSVPGYNNYLAEGFVNHNSGKTYAGCLRALILSQFPKNRGLIGRLTYPELRDTTRKTFFEVCPPEYFDDKRGGRWSPTENNLTLVNGSEIMFRHLDTVSEAELKSMNLGWFFIDQAEETSIGVWHVLQSRLRLNSVPNRYGFISCNPEPGSWIEDEFKRPFDEGRLKKDFFYMDTTTHDNPFNPPDYVQSLIDTYPDELRKRYIEGRWDVMQNQIYTEFDPKHHVINPFIIPTGWERIVSVDHGMVNPTAALFGAIDYDGNVFIYDEYYAPGIVSAHAREIKRRTFNQEISLWLIDPSTQAKTREKEGRPWSVLEEYEDYGLFFVPANNQKLAGINRVKEFLKLDNNRINPITRQKPAPKLYIFRTCINLLWEMKQYKWKKLRGLQNRNNPEEPTDYADHACDALYYMILSRFPPPERFPTAGEFITRADRVNANLVSQQSPTVPDEVLGSYANTDVSNSDEGGMYDNDESF